MFLCCRRAQKKEIGYGSHYPNGLVMGACIQNDCLGSCGAGRTGGDRQEWWQSHIIVVVYSRRFSTHHTGASLRHGSSVMFQALRSQVLNELGHDYER